MKKYILKNTNEEVNSGDIIELLLIKNNPDGSKERKVKTVRFSEEFVPLLLEEGVIEIQNDNKEDLKKNMIDFSDDDALEEEEKLDKKDEGSDNDIDDDVDEEEVGNFMEALTDLLETLGKSVKNLEKQVAYLSGKVEVLEKRDTCKCPKSCTFGSDFDEDKSVIEFMKGFGVIL